MPDCSGINLSVNKDLGHRHVALCFPTAGGSEHRAIRVNRRRPHRTSLLIIDEARYLAGDLPAIIELVLKIYEKTVIIDFCRRHAGR